MEFGYVEGPEGLVGPVSIPSHGTFDFEVLRSHKEMMPSRKRWRRLLRLRDEVTVIDEVGNVSSLVPRGAADPR